MDDPFPITKVKLILTDSPIIISIIMLINKNIHEKSYKRDLFMLNSIIMRVSVMHFSLVILILIACLNVATCGRILAITGSDLNSHFAALRGVIEHLAPFHNITFYVHSSLKYQPLPNVVHRSYSVPCTTSFFMDNPLFLKNPCDIDSYEIFVDYLVKSKEPYFEAILKSSGVSELFSRNETFDLMLLCGYASEQFSPLAHVLNIPLVQVLPSLTNAWHLDAVNNPNFLVNDFHMVLSERVTGFWGRLRKFIKGALYIHYFYNHFIASASKAASKFFPPGTPSLVEANRNTDLIFANTHSVMGYSRPNLPTVVEVGGVHIKPQKPLPSDLEEFISGAGKHGFIFFSLGTFVPESFMTEEIQNSILNVFSKLPQRVLWKWKRNLTNAPSNVRIAKWMPQADILAHRYIKLLISHGGMLSTQEAIYHAVPMLILPIVFDQHNNAFLVEKKGYGKTISFCEFTEDLFESSIKSIINNPLYYENMKEVSEAMRFQNKDLTERINKWVDFAIKFRGTKILKPVMPFKTWLYIPHDILLFFVIASIITLYALYHSCLYLFKIIFITSLSQKRKDD